MELSALPGRAARAALEHPGMAAFAAGALTVLAFAPFDLYALPLLTLALLFRLWRDATPAGAFRLGWLFGIGLLGFGVSWLHVSIDQFGNVGTPLAWLLTLAFILAVALLFGLPGWLDRLSGGSGANRSLLVLPALWALVEWLRGWLLTGFPWLALGYSQSDSPLAGYAPLLGVYGVGWLVALSAGLVLPAWHQPRRGRWLALLALLWLGGGLLRLHPWTHPAGAPLRVSLVQANIPQTLKWEKEMRRVSMEKYLALTRRHWDSDLVIWPETAVPEFLHRVQDDFILPLAREAQTHDSELLVGIPILDLSDMRYYNGAVVPGATEQIYYKRHLVPFGEFMPLKAWLAPLLDFMEIPMGEFTAGAADEPPLVRVAGHPAGVSICYEDAFGEEVLDALPAADFLVNLSNDAWFGDSLAPRQHLQIARMRALETGRPMLRATNTGISALIGPDGGILAASGAFEETVVSGTIQPMTGSTPYARTGNALAVGLFLLALAGGLLPGRKRLPRKGRSG